jgi:hypothetical protein
VLRQPGSGLPTAGRTEEEIPLLEPTLAYFEMGIGTDYPTTIATREDLAAAYEATGRAAEAAAMRQAQTLSRPRWLRNCRLSTDFAIHTTRRDALDTAVTKLGTPRLAY